MIIYLGTDHAGFELKEVVKKFLLDKGYQVKDFGAYSYKKRDDYPDFIHPVGRAVAKNPNRDKGIIFGGSAQGEAITANRYKGVRAVVFDRYSAKVIKLSKEHDNSNIASLGGFFLNKKEALKIVKLWLKTPFSEAMRHKRRIKKIDK